MAPRIRESRRSRPNCGRSKNRLISRMSVAGLPGRRVVLSLWSRRAVAANPKNGERRIERLLPASTTCRLHHRSLFEYLSDLLTAQTRGDPPQTRLNPGTERSRRAEEPTPGIEPGTPSLRGKSTPSRTYTADNERTRKSCKHPEVGVYDRDVSLAPVTNLVDAGWTSPETHGAAAWSGADVCTVDQTRSSHLSPLSPPAPVPPALALRVDE
jgi:hypothetical protein